MKMKWSSGWKCGKTGVVITYKAVPGSIKFVDSDVVKFITEPLRFKSKGVWGQHGMRYLRDRKNSILGVVFSSNDVQDIVDIFRNGCWQHGCQSRNLKPGMKVLVVPSDNALKDNSNANGVIFELDERAN